MEERTVKAGYDVKKGFVGTQVRSETYIECSNFDKLLVMFEEGSYRVINIPEKQYVHHEESKPIYVGVADKKKVISVIYRDPKSGYCYAKKFVVDKFILDKEYRFIGKGMIVEYFTTEPDAVVNIQFVLKSRQKISQLDFEFGNVMLKGVSAKGVRIASKEVKRIRRCKDRQ